MLEQKNDYTVPVLVKAMDMLEILSSNRRGMTLQELHTISLCSKTTVFRMLSTLWELGYVGKDEETHRYYISKKLFNLGVTALGEENLVEMAMDPMTRLRDEVKESVMLGTLDGSKVVLLEQVLGSHSFTFTLKNGSKIHLHPSAPGKVLFAAQTQERQKELLKKMTFEKFNENTIVDKQDFLREVEISKQKGYGVDVEEELYGVHCVGAPVYNRYGDVMACVWIAAPKGRLPISSFDDVGARIKAYAGMISRKLGYKEKK